MWLCEAWIILNTVILINLAPSARSTFADFIPDSVSDKLYEANNDIVHTLLSVRKVVTSEAVEKHIAVWVN